MSFTYEQLNKTDDLVGATTAGKTIIGQNNLVLWQDCFIWVHDQDGKRVQNVASCSGKAVLKKGWKYYFGGGTVKT